MTPQLIDNTLYDAFGQRQISIMFTQLNQYRVILEVDPTFRKSPRTCATFISRRRVDLHH